MNTPLELDTPVEESLGKLAFFPCFLELWGEVSTCRLDSA
jgi:hypothetical protein